jgi:hypothetical protein
MKTSNHFTTNFMILIINKTFKTNIKLVIIFIILFSCLDTYAQQINYSGGVAKTLIFNANNELLREIPMGKDVLLSYDEFYDSYNIMMTVQDGMMAFDLRYVKTDENSKVYEDKSNSGSSRFYVQNRLKSSEKIFILMKLDKQESNGQFFTVVYQFNNFNKSYKTNN